MENKKIKLTEETLNNLELKELLDLYNQITDFMIYLRTSILSVEDENE